MEPTENNVTETTTQVEQPVTEATEVVESSPVAEPVSVQTPEPIESKPEFVCTEAARPVEPIKQVPKKESFFKKHKALIGGITAGALTLAVLGAVFIPRLQEFSTTSKYVWSPWPPWRQQCKCAPSTVIEPVSLK